MFIDGNLTSSDITVVHGTHVASRLSSHPQRRCSSWLFHFPFVPPFIPGIERNPLSLTVGAGTRTSSSITNRFSGELSDLFIFNKQLPLDAVSGG